MKKLLLLFTALFLACALHATEVLKVATKIDKTALTTGDFLRYQVQILHPPHIQLQPIDLKKYLPELDVEAQPPREEPVSPAKSWFSHLWPFAPQMKSQVWVRWEWYLWPAQPGRWTIPPIKIQGFPTQDSPTEPAYQGTTQAVSFEVRPFFPKEAQNPEAPPTLKVTQQLPPALQNFSWGAWVLGWLGAMALMGLLWFFYQQKTGQNQKACPESPHEHALRRLQELEHFSAAHPKAVHEYYFRLSEIFREYLENRFGFLATAMTSQEFLPLLNAHTSYTPEEQQRIVLLTEKSDWVKYAEAQPPSSEQKALMQEVVALIEKATPVCPELPAKSKNIALHWPFREAP